MSCLRHGGKPKKYARFLGLAFRLEQLKMIES